MFEFSRFAIVGSLLSATLLGCAASERTGRSIAPAADVPYTIERLERDLLLGDGVRTIRIINPHGNVAIRNTQQRLLGVRAVVQKIGAKPESATITMGARGDVALLEVSYPSDAAHGTDRLVEGHRKGRADLAVFLPPRMRVEINTTFGNIDVRRVDDDIVARTREGTLVAAATGFLQLTTDSGDLRAWPMSGKASEAFILTTRSGNIVADVPLYGDIKLEARTLGRLDGEADLGLLWTERKGVNEAVRETGAATQSFIVRSETGDIFLQSATRPPTAQ